MDESKRPNRLKCENVPGAGLQVYADIPFSPNCAEFTMKKGYQPIMKSGVSEFNGVISYEPWIQFAPADWDAMLECVFHEMVALWNEKYAVKSEDVPL